MTETEQFTLQQAYIINKTQGRFTEVESNPNIQYHQFENSHIWRAETDNAFALLVNLSRMPVGEYVEVGTNNWAGGNVVGLVNTYTRDAQQVWEVLLMHASVNNNDAIIDFLNNETNIVWPGEERYAFIVHTSTLDANLEQALTRFSGGKDFGRQLVSVPTGETNWPSDVHICLQKVGHRSAIEMINIGNNLATVAPMRTLPIRR